MELGTVLGYELEEEGKKCDVAMSGHVLEVCGIAVVIQKRVLDEAHVGGELGGARTLPPWRHGFGGDTITHRFLGVTIDTS